MHAGCSTNLWMPLGCSVVGVLFLSFLCSVGAAFGPVSRALFAPFASASLFLFFVACACVSFAPCVWRWCAGFQLK